MNAIIFSIPMDFASPYTSPILNASEMLSVFANLASPTISKIPNRIYRIIATIANIPREANKLFKSVPTAPVMDANAIRIIVGMIK